MLYFNLIQLNLVLSQFNSIPFNSIRFDLIGFERLREMTLKIYPTLKVFIFQRKESIYKNYSENQQYCIKIAQCFTNVII